MGDVDKATGVRDWQRKRAVEWLHKPDAAHWRHLWEKFRERLEAVRDGAEWMALRELRRTKRSAKPRAKQVIEQGHEALSHALGLLHRGFKDHLREVANAPLGPEQP